MDLTLYHGIEGDEVILRTCTRCSAPDPSLGDNNSRALISFLLPVISCRWSLSLKGHFRPGGPSSCALLQPQRTCRFYTVFTMHCVPTTQDVGMQGKERARTHARVSDGEPVTPVVSFLREHLQKPAVWGSDRT